MDKRNLFFFFSVSIAVLGINMLFDTWMRSDEAPQPIAAAPVVAVTLLPTGKTTYLSSGTETFYVLENEYQQLVFSTKGGAIAEINLPLQSKNPKSHVKEIEVDRALNTFFPQHKTAGKIEQKGGYYPLLRQTDANPEYYAMALSDNADYQMTRLEKDLIQFTSKGITKTYRLDHRPYCFTLEIDAKESTWLCSGVPDAEIVSNSYSPTLRIQTAKGTSTEVETLDLPKKEESGLTPAKWISNCNGFLGILVQPVQSTIAGYKSALLDKLPSRLSSLDAHKSQEYPGYATWLPVASGKSTFRVFAGPYDSNLLAEVGGEDNYESAVEIQGWFSFISQPFAQFLSWLMNIFYRMTHSWALSIVLLTVALRAMMYPLNTWSIRSSVKMQQINPKIKAIQERYKSDPKRMQMEMMTLYREAGVNPFSGCLPVILQMPFLVGMFYLLKSSVPLRGAVFIPGWIDDLSAPDVLFRWKTSFWLIGNEFHLLPILMGAAMFLQQRFTAKLPKDTSQLTDAQRQQAAMGTMMSVLFIVMFYNFPSGLNIYFMLSTLLGLVQQMWITKQMEQKTA